jgi:hypothetical protein
VESEIGGGEAIEGKGDRVGKFWGNEKGLREWERRNRRGGWEPAHAALPFDFGLPEVDQKTEAEVRGSQVVEALHGVGGGEAVHAFHFDNEQVLDEEAGEVTPDRVAFVGDG